MWFTRYTIVRKWCFRPKKIPTIWVAMKIADSQLPLVFLMLAKKLRSRLSWVHFFFHIYVYTSYQLHHIYIYIFLFTTVLTMISRTILIITLVAVALIASTVVAWSPNQKIFGTPRTIRRKSSGTSPSTLTSPVQTSQSSSPTTSRTMLQYTNNNYKVKNPIVQQKSNERSSKTKLSNSVLASCDTLPSFRTAHGLLSPETVMRLEAMRSSSPRNHKNQALSTFLHTYRTHGPLSCVPMLSDPDVLPHLTLAMREIAQ